MATFRITAPDGTKFKVTAPDDATPEQVQSYAEQQFASMQKAPAQKPPAEPSMLESIGAGARDLGAGLVRGAGSIGATLLYPVDKATDLFMGDRNRSISDLVAGKKPMSRNEERRQGMDAGLRELLGVDTDSNAYAVGKFGGEVAGTLGAGGAIANGLSRIPGLAAAAPRALQAIRTSGMTTGAAPSGARAVAGDLGVRAAGGAVTGGAAAGMVNPDDAQLGASIGAAIPFAGKVAQGIGAAGRELIGATSGVGGSAITQAVKAGKAGGKAAEDFTGSMRGNVPIDDVLVAAKGNLETMRQAKQAAYRSGMADVSKDRTVLAFDGLDKALTNAAEQVTYRGVSGASPPQVKSQTAALAIAKMSDEVEAWRRLDPAEFHTPEGFDALKQKLGDILEGIDFQDKTARMAAGKIYAAAKDSIQSQAPSYAKVMGDYSKATSTMTEIEKALSLNPRASVDTSLRKLQSLMRNNANTNYGYRENLAQQMIEQGGNDIMPALAGQAMNTWAPRGIQRAMSGGGAVTLAATSQIPAALALAGASSPRLIGETAYFAGKAMSPLEQLIGPATRAAPVLAADRNKR